MAAWTGWIAVGLLVVAAAIPLAVRLRLHRRAPPTSPSTRTHVLVGLATAAVTFFHTLLAVLELGSPSAVGAGELALGLGALAFVVLLAHTGLGLQLREPKLRQRADKRRQHLTTATIIAVAVALHAVLLLDASP